MLTSKTKYALRAMVDLADAAGAGPMLIADIAARQAIPRRFLENILLELRKHGLVMSYRGKNGGYALARAADEITFADVMRAVEGPLALTPCTSRTAYQRCDDCLEEGECALREVLKKVRDASAAILENTTLAAAASAQGSSGSVSD
ncbi:MAG: Rrf2 family transcriptional regulator [Hyphomonadaceae bacterium]